MNSFTKNVVLPKYNKFFSESVPVIEGILGYSFKNKHLLRQAFVHVGCLSTCKTHNQELEYIGDRVLYAVLMYKNTKEKLLNKDGTVKCGKNLLSINRSVITDVNNANLIKQSLRKSLSKFLICNKVISDTISDKSKMHADLFEAVIGAVAVDCDWNIPLLETVYDNLTNKVVRGKGLLKRIESERI